MTDIYAIKDDQTSGLVLTRTNIHEGGVVDMTESNIVFLYITNGNRWWKNRRVYKELLQQMVLYMMTKINKRVW